MKITFVKSLQNAGLRTLIIFHFNLITSMFVFINFFFCSRSLLVVCFKYNSVTNHRPLMSFLLCRSWCSPIWFCFVACVFVSNKRKKKSLPKQQQQQQQNSGVYMWISNSQSISPPAFPLVIVNSFYNSESLFLILSEVSQRKTNIIWFSSYKKS